jgi:nitrite reductase/ring-hydroxylating ferredoxin subunit
VSAVDAGPGTSPCRGTRILGRGDLAEGESRKFLLRCGDREIECFVVRWRGELHAFVNQCRHVAMSLDWVENQFFTEEGDFLLCPTHGALYAPDTGECVSGPPCGKSLHAVPLTESGGEILALCPDPLP